MTLSAGTRLGPYEIRGPIGSGGMGEVYRARDTRLDRDIAVKVLPTEYSQDPDRLRRFEQEARLAGSLNHPNVLTLLDVGSHENAPYLVTELLEGRTVAEVLAAGPLPARKAVEHAQQIARGLAAAHEHGVIHRDLKPANLFLTKDGRVKILDFGIAKLTHAEAPGEGGSKVTTATAEGLAVGTAGYMSPEQVRGHAVDARSDIFALGAVVYEMLSGRRAFRGETAVDTMTAILTKEPEELSRPGLEVPAGLERIVRRCLEKDPAERFQSAKDIAFALEAEGGVSRSATTPVAAIRPRGRRLAAGAVGLCLLLAGAAGGLLYARKVRERPLPKVTQLTFRRGVVDRARFTPDGKTVVYGAFWDGSPPEIFTTRVESPESRSLGLPPARLLSVSSTSELAILLPAPGDRSDLTTGTLARVPLSGGEPRRVLDDVYNADWSPDGRELAVIRRAGPVGGFYGREFQLEYPIGTVLARSVGPWLRVSPRGDRVAVSDLSGIAVYDRAGRRTSVQSPPVVQVLAWDPDGGLWLTGGEKWRTRSLWWANPGGPPREVYRVTGSLGLQDVSADGRLLLNDGFERVGVSAKGPREETERELGVFSWTWVVDFSADGSRALLCEGDSPGRAETRAYVVPTRGGQPVRLGEGTPLALSPEGTWALVSSSGPRPQLVVTPTGPGEPRTILSAEMEWDPTSSLEPPWFLDEARLLLHAGTSGRRSRTFLVDVSSGEPRPVTPEGVVSVRGSYRDGAVLGIARDGALARYPLRGGEAQPLVAHLPPGGIPLRASEDGRYVFVGHAGMPYRVDRLELATGRLAPWKALQPDDLTGVTHVVGAALTADGGTYAYTYGRYFLDLYLVEGLRH